MMIEGRDLEGTLAHWVTWKMDWDDGSPEAAAKI
jgi:hypothetical protein